MALRTAATNTPACATLASAPPAAPIAASVSASRALARARMERPPEVVGGIVDPRRTRPAPARALSRHRTRTAVVPNIPL